MDINISKDIGLPCIKPLYDTWGAKTEAGNWNIILPYDFSKHSVKERNSWYTDTMMSTVNSLSEFIGFNLVLFQVLKLQ